VAGLNVSYASMSGAASKLTAGQAEIEGQLAGLKGLIDSLVAEGFVTDSASKSFEASYTEFNKGVGDVLQGLTGMAKYLNAAAQTFSDADSQLASALKG
jgi:WXG100 family type VII secretion target